ncbi:oxidoreductase [Streptomyces xanthochromogenes]
MKILSRGIRLPLAALSGLLAGFAALAVAELVSAAVRPESGPVIAVGGASIDRTPPAVKDWAIRHFGTNDKLVLQLGILAVLALLALVLGVLALRLRRTGAAGVLLFGVVGALAATGRPDSTSLADALPSVAGAVAGAGLLYFLIGRLTLRGGTSTGPGVNGVEGSPGEEGPAAEVADGSLGWDRRGFVIAAGAAAAASSGAGLLGRSLNDSRGQGAVASRAKVTLPRPASRPGRSRPERSCTRRASARSSLPMPTSTASTPPW